MDLVRRKTQQIMRGPCVRHNGRALAVLAAIAGALTTLAALL